MFGKSKNKPKDDQPSAKTILVIDDEETSIKIVEHTLKEAGYNVLTATSGEDGLRIARENNPEVIITDVLMPSMDGFMLLKELKNHEKTKDTVILVLTARENVGDTFQRLGTDSFLTKPVDPEQLISEIKKLTS